MSNKLLCAADEATRLRDLIHGIDTLAGEGKLTESLMTPIETADATSQILVERIEQARAEQ